MPDLPQVNTQDDPSSYFLNDADNEKPSFGQRSKPFFETFKVIMIKIWPFIYKMINSVIYYSVHFVKAFVEMVIDEIKNFKG